MGVEKESKGDLVLIDIFVSAGWSGRWSGVAGTRPRLPWSPPSGCRTPPGRGRSGEKTRSGLPSASRVPSLKEFRPPLASRVLILPQHLGCSFSRSFALPWPLGCSPSLNIQGAQPQGGSPSLSIYDAHPPSASRVLSLPQHLGCSASRRFALPQPPGCSPAALIQESPGASVPRHLTRGVSSQTSTWSSSHGSTVPDTLYGPRRVEQDKNEL